MSWGGAALLMVGVLTVAGRSHMEDRRQQAMPQCQSLQEHVQRWMENHQQAMKEQGMVGQLSCGYQSAEPASMQAPPRLVNPRQA